MGLIYNFKKNNMKPNSERQQSLTTFVLYRQLPCSRHIQNMNAVHDIRK